MPYAIDLAKVPLAEFQTLLLHRELLPGRRPLLADIQRRFAAIAQSGAGTVAAVRAQLRTPAKLTGFAAATGVPEPYLTLLNREMGSLCAKPVPLADFPGIDQALLETLRARGLQNSRDYWEAGAAEGDMLYCLCDLARINGVGACAARAFYEAGYRTVQAVAGADAQTLLCRIVAVNEAMRFYQARLGLSDMRFCIDNAALLLRYGG